MSLSILCQDALTYTCQLNMLIGKLIISLLSVLVKLVVRYEMTYSLMPVTCLANSCEIFSLCCSTEMYLHTSSLCFLCVSAIFGMCWLLIQLTFSYGIPNFQHLIINISEMSSSLLNTSNIGTSEK